MRVRIPSLVIFPSLQPSFPLPSDDIGILTCSASRTPGRGRERVKTETNTAYGVVSRREDPEYEVISLPQSRHRNTQSDL